MTYRELLDLYKLGKLDDGRKIKVEEEIEKQEAISDYLYEEGIIPQFENTFEDENQEEYKESIEMMQQEKDFIRLVNKSIKKAFVKMGIIVCIATLLVVLFTQLVLPNIVSCFYYNPGKEISKDSEQGRSMNQMSRDIAVFTELLIPAYVRNNVVVEAKGYGDYDISIYQDVSYNGRFTNVAGKIEQGRLTLYDMNTLVRPTGNAFAWFQMPANTTNSLTELYKDPNKCFYAGYNAEESTKVIEKLSEQEKYVAYVTLDRMMKYEKFIQFIDTKDSLDSIWCAVATNGIYSNTNIDTMFRADNIGFQCSLTSSTPLKWDKGKYPNLLLWEESINAGYPLNKLEENMKTEKFMKTHFVSMLRYLSNQDKFLSMMNESPETFSEAAAYVQEHGVTVYGFAAVLDKKTMLELTKLDEIYAIYPQPLS